ncbi:MAG: hypothetical protein J1E60_04890 [Christensenellaceae bacterium]|nr:hypothetical protein [Christensenellaceae bacterium]
MPEHKNEQNAKPRTEGNKVINFFRSSEHYLRMASEKYDNDDLFGSLVMLRRAEELDPKDEEIKLRIAENLVEMQCYDSAMDSLAPLLYRQSELCSDAVNTLGYCYMGLNEYGAAMDAFHYFLANSPEDCTDVEIASVQGALEFCENYRDFADTPAKDIPILRDAAEVRIEKLLEQTAKLAQEQKFDEIIKIVEPNLKKNPADSRLIHVMLTACYCGHEYDKGIKLLNSLPITELEKIENLCVATMLHHSVGNEAEVDAACDKLMHSNIDTVDELLRASLVLLECGRKKDALKLAKKVYDDCPYEKNVIHNYAHAAFENGDNALARKLYERVLVISPNNSAAKYYYDLCADNDTDRQSKQFTPELLLPAAEMMRRIVYVEQKCKNGEVEIAKLWQDEQFRIIAEWVLSDMKSPFFEIFLMLLAAIDYEKLRALLLRMLIDRECEEKLRNLAMHMLDDMSERGPHFVYDDGRLLGYTTMRSSKASIPASYRRVWECFRDRYKDDEEDVLKAAEGIMLTLVLVNELKQPSLPSDQQFALAGAIEYYSLLRSGRNIDVSALLAKYMITMRRLNNALKKLDDCLAHAAEIHGGGDHDDDYNDDDEYDDD